MGRLVLVPVSPRTPPGLLSWPAWQALHAAPVRVRPDSPQRAALRGAGCDVVPLQGQDSVLAAELVAAVRAGGDVAVLLDAVQDAALVGLLAQSGRDLAVEVVPGSWDPPGARLLDAVAVMDRLRSPGGCPWDAAQTHTSLRPYLIEEAYEVLQAIEDGDDDALRDELGDLLLQVLFHARVAQEDTPGWSVDDVAQGLVDKLVRRHPHVFAGASADDLEAAWEQSKLREGRTSPADGVALGAPALALAAKLQRRARRAGVPVPAYDGLGGRLWELVRQADAQGEDPEDALRTVARTYHARLSQ